MVENVPEFLNWGPIGANGQPLKSRKGETFNAWIAALESCGYRCGWKILRACDYGDPTSRRRLFVQAVRGRRKIVWPNPTHGEEGEFGNLHPLRTARDIINWDLPTESVFERKRPLAKKTMERIYEGLMKYGLAPFLVPQQSRHRHRTLDKPIQTITAHATGEALIQPYIVAWDNQSGSGVWPADKPLTTICTKGRHGVAEPFLVKLRGTSKEQIKCSSQSVNDPIPTITAGGGHIGLTQPYLINVAHQGKRKPYSLDKPLGTVTGKGEKGLCQPYLVNYYGNGGALSIDEPLDTVTTKERFGLCRPSVEIDGEKYIIDIHFRMLQPEELAAAQGFPDNYLFKGTKTQVVKQIGNAVPCNLARALVLAALTQNNDISEYTKERKTA